MTNIFKIKKSNPHLKNYQGWQAFTPKGHAVWPSWLTWRHRRGGAMICRLSRSEKRAQVAELLDCDPGDVRRLVPE